MDTRDVFRLLGFEEKWETSAGRCTYVYDFGNLHLSAIECVNKYYNTVYLLTGVQREPRSIGLLKSEMALTVDSFEQGVALIAYIMGRDFEPARPTSWLAYGRAWQSFLPWERDKQLRAEFYASRPKCLVERDWFRVVRPRLYAMAKEATEDDLVWLTFDGEVLRFVARQSTVIVPAIGEAWPDRHAVRAVELDAVPKRISGDQVQLIVWENTLAISKGILSLVSSEKTKPSEG